MSWFRKNTKSMGAQLAAKEAEFAYLEKVRSAAKEYPSWLVEDARKLAGEIAELKRLLSGDGDKK